MSWSSYSSCSPKIPYLESYSLYWQTVITVVFFRNYVIYYRPQADALILIRILHGARDEKRQF